MTKIKQDIKMYQRIALLMIADIAFIFLASFLAYKFYRFDKIYTRI